MLVVNKVNNKTTAYIEKLIFWLTCSISHHHSKKQWNENINKKDNEIKTDTIPNDKDLLKISVREYKEANIDYMQITLTLTLSL